VGRTGTRAVVVGGSIAGLAAARSLSESHDEVVIVDRDDLAGGTRRRVPQARHVHALLPSGHAVLEAMFPGFGDELAAAGAPNVEASQVRWHLGGHRFARSRSEIEGVLASRPLLETTLRARVRDLAGVEVIDRCDVVGLVTSEGRVEGVRVLRQADGSATEALQADLVVDCSGRGSRTPERLGELGFRGPPTEVLHVGLGYATRTYRCPASATGGDQTIVVGPVADCLRSGVAIHVEADRWIVTLGGLLGDHPPTDPDHFERWATTLPAPDLGELVAAGSPLDDPVPYRFPASVRHRYERLRRFPQGLLVLGDAVASFNPIYGQGMSVALLQAAALQEHLAAGRPPDDHRLRRRIAKIVDAAWDLAVGSDLSLPQVDGPRSVRTRLLNRYVARLQAAATHDADLATTFALVAGLVAPPARLLGPRAVWGALTHRG
jgi:2-polyprenyl-6-methoxyphenol hydroxylase-like FAD-dependent oxidoreductase